MRITEGTLSATGEASHRKSYLPENKQFLVTRNVPSLCRANTYALHDAKEEVVEDEDGDGWLSTHTGYPLANYSIFLKYSVELTIFFHFVECLGRCVRDPPPCL